jgi:hypothetical protein
MAPLCELALSIAGRLMASATYQILTERGEKPFVERWFFTVMAVVMLAVSIAGFAPAIVNPAGRHSPLSPLAAAHGIVFFAWLLLFLIQSLLAATRRVAWHRRLGVASAFVLGFMIPLAYAATVAMVRRGFDLSGDQKIELHPRAGFLDPYNASIFNFGDLLLFTLLAVAAICYRRRPEIHKRLMLFANIALMGAPITHVLGHTAPLLLTPANVVISILLFLLAAVARDYLVAKRIHPLTAGLAIAMFASYPIRGVLIGPSASWHRLASWLSR